MEATNIILTPPKHDPISITCVYIPPPDENLFTIDIEYFIQRASNCVLFGDFNATHNAWSCNNNTNRGRHHYNFANMVNLNIAFPPTPTRFGHNSANTIDIVLIKNFYYLFTICSIDDLSSVHNPVFLNFNFKLAVEPPNPRAVSTDWNDFKINLNKNLSLFDYHPNNINNTNDLEYKIAEFTEAVIETHSHASRPIGIDCRNFTPQHINQLLKLKNYLRKRRNSHLSIENKVLLYTAVMRPILAYASPVWGYAAKTYINILDTLQSSLTPPRAANWSQYSLYPASNQRAASKLSVTPKNFENFPPRRSTVATPSGFHRPTNRRHATKQNEKPHSRHAPHGRLVLIWD
ncbi:putative RNA-directed DNA polymerase from transposon X-element [Trichonephila clavipes]|uniref:Putative RNA-directed DNA polymerase from transposon X-element n=1 Tax=Trichonephila clavipes TaxID=2585209 RepID=A0A8X6SDW8_TRICX|nr:putative RNA-directed DNA polymerase from transposon X-element [Trichonephila clavipes]